VNIVQPVQEIEVVDLPEVEVSNVEMGEQSVEFDVSEPGVPVLVRVSYFPNWTAHGAEGPYRIGPNQMVVVPTDTHVRLEFERTTSDVFFYGLTVVGIVLALLARFRDWNFPKLAPPLGGGMSSAPPGWPSPSTGDGFDDIAWAPGHPPSDDGEPPPPPPSSAPMAPALPPPSPGEREPDDRSGSSVT
jgi:hypothetical protein